jgi:DNA-directed RNA polymerase subunit RPC12/RpoP
MTPIIIPCPQCGRELKIRDRNLLGRKGKCPKCGHAFVMEEPAAVELELAESTNFPAEGTGARYISTPATAPPQPVATPLPFAVATAPNILGPDVVPSSLPVRKKAKRGRGVQFAVMAIGVLILAGVGVYALNTPAGKVAKSTAHTDGDSTTTDSNDSVAAAGTGSLTASPTQGDPIPLEMIPSGAQILIHIRPAELWEAESQGEEFRYCLGPLGEYLDQQIKSLCKKSPKEIESVLFAWIANTRGTPPSLAMVVRLKEGVCER